LALLNLISPVSIAGSLSGQIVIRGNPSSPELSSKMVLAGLKPIQPDLKNLPQAEVSMDAHLGQGLLTTQAVVSGFGPEPGRADLKLPVRFSLDPFQLDTPAGGPLEGRLRATLDLGLIPALLSWDDQKVAGLALLDFSLSGTINDPQASGSMSIQKGRYENLRSGTILKDISAEMKAQGDEIRLTSLRAADGEKGLITADGVIKLDAGRKFPFQYQVTINQAKLVRLDMLSAVVSGAVNAAGDTSRIQLTGKTKVNTAEVNIPKTLPPQMTEIKVKEINLAPGQRKSPPQPEKRPVRLRLEVEVDFPGQLYIRGRGLDSEWKGALKVEVSASKPVLHGTMSVVRGRYTLLSRVFELTEGALNFQGESPPAPLINVIAEAKIKETTARIRVTGSTSSIKLDLESDPPLPRDEVLSRVLFGETLAKISPVQAISLAQAVNELFGGPGPSLDVLGRTRKLLGIDVLDVRQGEEGAVVGVGKYIGEKIYVEARKGASPTEDKVAVEIDLGRNFTLESEVGVSAGSGLRFNWKYDY
ncbi:MAG: translocation/assembly module TamB domain-containing protein, partial [Pseudomonadota bacterium]